MRLSAVGKTICETEKKLNKIFTLKNSLHITHSHVLMAVNTKRLFINFSQHKKYLLTSKEFSLTLLVFACCGKFPFFFVSLFSQEKKW